MIEKDIILDKYYRILELLDKSPGEEEALKSLIDLEETIKEYLFDVLRNKHGEKRNQSNIFSKFGKGNKDRDKLESLVMKKVAGDKVSINNLVDMFIKKINEILEMHISTEEKIRLLNIQYLKIKETILPPDYDKTPITGSNNGWIEKGKDYDKFGLLIQLLREKGIYTDDILAIEGTNKKNMVRKDSYICLYIPRINKTIFINNNYGEATFIYDGILDIEQFVNFGKEGLRHSLKKFIFSEKNIDDWKEEILEALLYDFNRNKEVGGKKEDIKNLKLTVGKRYKKAEFLGLFNQLTVGDRHMIYSAYSYFKRVKQFPSLPKSYSGLIHLLGGNHKCTEGGYVKALIEGTGEDYFENWENTKKNKIKIQTREEFLIFYNKLSIEDQEIIFSEGPYRKRARNYKGIPQVYQGLITLLGGNAKCMGGGYVKALIEGTGEDYLENWENTRKNKIKTREEFLIFYGKLSVEDQEIISRGAVSYKKRVKKYANMPQKYVSLIVILGGNAKCIEGGYVKALIEGKGEDYLENWENTRKNKIKTREEFLIFYGKLSVEDQEMIYGGLRCYTKWAKNYLNLPKSYAGLIKILGGNTKYKEGLYIKALIEGTSEDYLEKLDNTRKNKIQTREEFLIFYGKLSVEDQETISRSDYLYRKFVEDFPNLPKSYEGLINLLGGDAKYKKGGYIKALIEGTGEDYLKKKKI